MEASSSFISLAQQQHITQEFQKLSYYLTEHFVAIDQRTTTIRSSETSTKDFVALQSLKMFGRVEQRNQMNKMFWISRVKIKEVSRL